MFKKFKEVSAPAIFTKGVMRYKQGYLEDAKKLLIKAGNWMPDLQSDDFYLTVLLLVEYRLTSQFDIQRFKDVLGSLKDSPYKDSSDYSIVVSHLEQIINEGIT